MPDLLVVYVVIAICMFPRICSWTAWTLQRRLWPHQKCPDSGDWILIGGCLGGLISLLWLPFGVIAFMVRQRVVIHLFENARVFCRFMFRPPAKVRIEQAQKQDARTVR